MVKHRNKIKEQVTFDAMVKEYVVKVWKRRQVNMTQKLDLIVGYQRTPAATDMISRKHV